MENIRKRQADKYLEEAELGMIAAEGTFKQAKEIGKDLWAHVVKSCYDAMEQAISASLAAKGLLIPKDHPAKVIAFLNSYLLQGSEIEEILSKWLGKRSRAQYVDVRHERICVPHEMFDKWDAEDALKDARRVIDFVKKLLGKA